MKIQRKKRLRKQKNGSGLKLLISLGIIEGLAVIIYQGIRKLKETYHNFFLFKNEKLIYEYDFLGDSMAVCASRVIVELYDADFYEKGQELDIFAVMGDITIQVPSGMSVYLDMEGSKSFLSGIYIAGAENNEDAYIRLKCNLYASRVEVEEME